jgi:ribosomal protein S27E
MCPDFGPEFTHGRDQAMQVRCQRCGWSVNLGRDWMAAALVEATEKKLKYYQIECGKCRHSIKVPIRQIRRFAPRPAPGEGAEDSS